MTTTQKLPHWDIGVFFPGLDAPEFTQAFSEFEQEINELTRWFDEQQIDEGASPALDGRVVETVETSISRLNAVLEHLSTLYTYVSCIVDTNSLDTQAQARLSELQNSFTLLSPLLTRFTAWIGSLDVEGLTAQSQIAHAHAYTLRQAKREAQHLMSTAEEALAAELNASSGTAWAKLHSTLTSQLAVQLEVDGEVQELPMSVIRNMSEDPDRKKRRKAYEAELASWAKASVPLAAALNSIKNEVNVLSGRRKWTSPLDSSLFGASIDRETLDAMLSAARESFPDFRRYLRAKARMLGLERLAWYDIEAPVVEGSRVWEYNEAANFVVEQFGNYSQRLANFAARAFRERWIDAEPRSGKVDGAYCTELIQGQSRVLANFVPSYGGMSTLAHELGHAYHNLNLVERTPLQRTTPMTLAETASIFCETIVRNAALHTASQQDQIAILEASLQNSNAIVVDIMSRFIFEQGVFEKRKQRELSVEELNELMLDAQRQTYGDGLDQSALHPYMWAVKGHYYSTGLSFYNYPYMFGLLFGLGLYSRYQQDPETFKQVYDELLSSTGMADATTLAGRFGIDLRTVDFWRSSLDIVRSDIEQFEQLAGM